MRHHLISSVLVLSIFTLCSSAQETKGRMPKALKGQSQQPVAQVPKSLPPSLVDMEGFVEETIRVARYRKTRIVDLDKFLALAETSDTLILDTRSRDAYDRKHLRGAVHLNFSDFTADKLAKVIPNKNTRILIYCNNNLGGDKANFAAKSLSLALNIPTFVNLYGYGYQNVYELGVYVSVDDPRLVFAGTDVATVKR